MGKGGSPISGRSREMGWVFGRVFGWVFGWVLRMCGIEPGESGLKHSGQNFGARKGMVEVRPLMAQLVEPLHPPFETASDALNPPISRSRPMETRANPSYRA